MTWPKRLKKVFNIDLKTCQHCGGATKVITDRSDRSIEDPVASKQVLAHLQIEIE